MSGRLEAFMDGRAAHFGGKRITDNPHAFPDDEDKLYALSLHRAWRAGFTRAADENAPETSRDRLEGIVERLEAVVADLPERLQPKTPKPDTESTRHTPGPWEAKCPSFKGWEVCSPSRLERPLATIYAGDEDYGKDGGRYHDKECKANARLIAAAPDLLAACKDISNRLFGSGMNSSIVECHARIINAIRLAEGRAE